MNIRVTVPLNIENHAPTVLKPEGHLQGRIIQGPAKHFTLFITDAIEHTPPINSQDVEDDRKYLVFDFELKRLK